MTGERVPLFGRPGLLVAGLSAVILGERRGRARPLGVMDLQISLVDTPATPRRNIRVVGLDRVLLESAVADEVPGVLAEDPLVEVSKDRVTTSVLGDDPGPVLVTTLAGGPLDESFEFAGCVPAVISTVAPATFPLVLEIPLEAVVEWRR